MSMNLYNPQQEDINYLRKLIDTGELTPQQLSNMSMKVNVGYSPVNNSPYPEDQARHDERPALERYYRKTNPELFDAQDRIDNPQFYDQPKAPPPNALQAMMQPPPEAGSNQWQNVSRGTGVMQTTNPDGTQNAPININSGPDSPMPPRDASRSPVELANGSKGYWGKDGNVYLNNGQLYVTPEMAQANKQIQMANEDRQLKIAQTKSSIAHTNAQTLNESIKDPSQPHYDQSRGVFVQMGDDGKAIVTTPDFGAGAGNVGSQAMGDAALEGVDANTASIVRRLSQGLQAPPSGFALKSPAWTNIMGILGRYDPSYDMTNYAARAQTAKDYAPGGKDGERVRALNQAIHHGASLSDSIDQLNNSNIAPAIVNPVVNTVEKGLFGDTRQGVYKINADALALELRKLYAGASGGSLAELKDWQEAFDVNAGKNQQRAYLQKGMQLLQGGVDSIKDGYTRGMGPRADFNKLVSPSSQADFARIMSGAPKTSGGGNSGMLDEARAAIAQGASRDAVNARLKQNGLGPL